MRHVRPVLFQVKAFSDLAPVGLDLGGQRGVLGRGRRDLYFHFLEFSKLGMQV